MIGGLVASIDPRAPFWVAAALGAANFVFGYFILPESLKPDLRRPFTLSRANPLTAFAAIRRLPGLKLLLTVSFIYSLTFNVWPAIWSYYGAEAFGWNAQWIGISLATFGICMAVAQATLVGPMIKRYGERRTATIGMGFEVATYTYYGFATSGFWAIVATPVTAIGGVTGPALQGLMSRAVPEDQQGELQGIATSLNALAMILAPLVMTLVFGYFTRPGTPLYLPGAPFLLSAVGMVAAVTLFVAGSRARPAP
jgi:DHA1 family tetracycline resistance protein-like MFS transporter